MGITRAALDQALNVKENTTACQQQQFDIISCIQGYVNTSTVEYLPFHIRGHQDNKNKSTYLRRLELLNVKVNWMAKDYWVEKYDKGIVTQRKYFKCAMPMGWKISCMRTQVINTLVSCLRENIEEDKVTDY